MNDRPEVRLQGDKLDYLITLHETATEMAGKEREETVAWRKKMEIRVEKTETQLFLYKTVIQVLKWTFGVLGAILTLKFGDIGKYFHG